MNERIQELLIEAHKQTDGGIYNGHLSVWTEKFAELIVRECCDVLHDNEMGGYQVNYVLKDHFGVEQ
jgi:hypothetical protein